MKKRYYIVSVIIIIAMIITFNVGGIRGNLYILSRNIPKNIILFNTRDYDKINTRNFIIKHKSKDKEIVDLVVETSENYYDEVCKLFNYYPKKKTLIILYDDSEELLKNSNLQKSKPPMGVYYASTIQILSPRLWVSNKKDINKRFTEEGPIVHELTHLLIDDITKGNYPLWFTEGLALYSEYAITNYEWGKEIEDKNIYTMEQLNKEFHELDSYLAYTQSLRVVKYIVDEHGFDSIGKILKKLQEGYSFTKAYETITKDKISSLNI